MKQIRVLMMLAALLASATVAHAQSISAGSLQAIRDVSDGAVGWQVLPDGTLLPIYPPALVEGYNSGVVKPSTATVEAIGQVKSNPPPCSIESECSWLQRALLQCGASCQRLRAMCASGQATRAVAEPACGLCPATAAGCPRPTPTGHLMLGLRVHSASGLAGCCQPNAPSCGVCCGINELLQYVQAKPAAASAPCCCSKACACCENCKAKAAQGIWVPAPPMRRVIEIHRIAPSAVGQVVPCPMQPGLPPVWTGPAPAHTPGIAVATPWPANTPPAGLIPRAPSVRPMPRFETPDFEAHCEKITHRGDMVILEGNVLLLCKKHAQPMRVEAQRVLVNMRDGSFTVENALRATSATTSFGVMRTSAEMPMTHRIIAVVQEPIPVQIPVLPSASPRVIEVQGVERIYIGEQPPMPGR